MATSNKHAPTEEEVEYGEWALGTAEEKPAEVPWYQSFSSAAVKGVEEGVHQLGEIAKYLTPGTTGIAREDYPEVEEREQSPFEKFSFPDKLPKTRAELEDKRLERKGLLDEYFPTADEGLKGAVSGGIERAGKIAPALVAGGVGVLGAAGRAAIGGALGEGTKQIGGGPVAQEIAEVVGTIGPDLAKVIPKRFLTTAKGASQQEAIDFARKAGMSEEELNLALGERGAFRDLATDVASKGGATVKAFDKTRQALGKMWDTLKASPSAQGELTGQQSSQLINKISDKLSKLAAGSRKEVLTDFSDLIGGKMTGENLMDFWQKLNYYIQKGERGLGTLKPEIQKALNQISPEMGGDFAMTNKLYGNFSDLAGRMRPDLAEHLISKGEKGLLISAVTTGNYPLLKKVLGPLGVRKISQWLITNPRFKNLSARLINGIERGSPAIAQKVYEQLVVEVGKVNADAAKKMSGMDFEEFFESFEEEKE